MATAPLSQGTAAPKRTANQRRGKKKKKRISKHVLKAKESGDNDQKNSGATQQKIKDPSDVHAYLTGWKASGGVSSSEGAWKFNKNTQNWLIRHAYDVEKVPKASFSILLDYLAGLKGEDTKKRLLADATRRALRYKDYEKKQQHTEGEATKEEAQGSEKEESEEPGKDAMDNDKEQEAGEHTRWEALNDHDKRKEYKRARKILECFKQ